jgi:hypothetical protein
MDNREAASLYAGRVLSHGQITDLTEAFTLDGLMFSIFLIPKDDEIVAPLVVTCKTLQNAVAAATPMVLNWWNPHALLELPADAIDLDVYDVYWAAGHDRLKDV